MPTPARHFDMPAPAADVGRHARRPPAASHAMTPACTREHAIRQARHTIVHYYAPAWQRPRARTIDDVDDSRGMHRHDVQCHL